MRGAKWWVIAVATVGMGWSGREAAGQAAPAAPTYVGVQRTIDSIRQAWAQPRARPVPNTEGWNALFNAILEQLQAYGAAGDDGGRWSALSRLDEIAGAMEGVEWPPAAEVRDELRGWLKPRLRLETARKGLGSAIAAMPAAGDPAAAANRGRWAEFAGNTLGGVLRGYDGAQTVQQRLDALRRVHEALAALDRQLDGKDWAPATDLKAALDDLFNRRNLDIAADRATVAPVFEADLVQTGPVTRKGYTSMVTAGPKTGFGLREKDGGISFYNSQSMVSVTPIHDFQQQLEQDERGRRAAELYYFTATTFDWSNMTVTATITPDGLDLSSDATHCIDASVGSSPVPGGHVKRTIAASIGMNKEKITQKVYEGALPNFQQRIPEEAREEAEERLTAEEEKRNADLRAKYLPGNDTASVKDYLIRQLALRSRPDAIFVGGRFEWRGAPGQRGADAPQPSRLASGIEPGVTADLHLGSLLSSAVSGLWQQDKVKSTRTLMIETKAVPPGGSPRDAVKLTENASFADYLKAVDAARAAHDPKVQALRIARPEAPPEFAADARGFLVAVIRDFQLDAPAPDPQAGGNLIGVPAKVLRIKSPLVEVAISYRVDSSSPGALRLKGKVEEFNPGTAGEVIAINDDENQGKPLTRFQSAIIMTGLGARIRSQSIDIDLSELPIPGFRIKSVSPLDPSGWARVTLERTHEQAALRGTEPAQEVQPPTTHGPEQPGAATPSPTGATPTLNRPNPNP